MTTGPTAISLAFKPNHNRRQDGWQLSELTGRRRRPCEEYSSLRSQSTGGPSRFDLPIGCGSHHRQRNVPKCRHSNTANVRLWLKADLQRSEIDFRLIPNSGHSEVHAGLPLLTHSRRLTRSFTQPAGQATCNSHSANLTFNAPKERFLPPVRADRPTGVAK